MLHDKDHGKVILDSEFEFSHLSEDKLTATFKMDPGAEEYHDEIRDRLREYGENMNIEEPQHTIQVRHEITDGPIPGISFDYEKFQLSCNWRELYTVFFGEIILSGKLTQDWVNGQESYVAGLKNQMESGEFDMGRLLTEAMTAFVSGNSKSIRAARRARIKRQLRDAGNPNWDPETDLDVQTENEILKTLEQKREFSTLQEFSDEEGDEEGEDEDEEEDEWEDDDGEDES
jgi:hypothetical protein